MAEVNGGGKARQRMQTIAPAQRAGVDQVNRTVRVRHGECLPVRADGDPSGRIGEREGRFDREGPGQPSFSRKVPQDHLTVVAAGVEGAPVRRNRESRHITAVRRQLIAELARRDIPDENVTGPVRAHERPAVGRELQAGDARFVTPPHRPHLSRAHVEQAHRSIPRADREGRPIRAKRSRLAARRVVANDAHPARVDLVRAVVLRGNEYAPIGDRGESPGHTAGDPQRAFELTAPPIDFSQHAPRPGRWYLLNDEVAAVG